MSVNLEVTQGGPWQGRHAALWGLPACPRPPPCWSDAARELNRTCVLLPPAVISPGRSPAPRPLWIAAHSIPPPGLHHTQPGSEYHDFLPQIFPSPRVRVLVNDTVITKPLKSSAWKWTGHVWSHFSFSPHNKSERRYCRLCLLSAPGIQTLVSEAPQSRPQHPRLWRKPSRCRPPCSWSPVVMPTSLSMAEGIQALPEQKLNPQHALKTLTSPPFLLTSPATVPILITSHQQHQPGCFSPSRFPLISVRTPNISLPGMSFPQSSPSPPSPLPVSTGRSVTLRAEPDLRQLQAPQVSRCPCWPWHHDAVCWHEHFRGTCPPLEKVSSVKSASLTFPITIFLQRINILSVLGLLHTHPTPV